MRGRAIILLTDLLMNATMMRALTFIAALPIAVAGSHTQTTNWVTVDPVAIAEDAEMNAFGGWFDTDFRGSTADPCPRPVTLTT